MRGSRPIRFVLPVALAALLAGCGQGASGASFPASSKEVSAIAKPGASGNSSSPRSPALAGNQLPNASQPGASPNEAPRVDSPAEPATQDASLAPLSPATGERLGTLLPLPEPPGGARARARVLSLANGAAIVVGGLTAQGATAQVLYYDPLKARFIECAPLAHARYRHEATLLPGPDGVLGTQDDWVLVTGGFDGEKVLDSVELIRLDPSGDPRKATTIELPPLPLARADHQAVLVPLGRGPTPWSGGAGVLLTGGKVPVPGGFVPTSSAILYRAELDAQGLRARAVHVSQPRVARFDHTALLLPGADGVLGTDDDRVLVFGGTGADPDDPQASDALVPLSSGEIYEPALDRWSTLRWKGEVPAAAQPRTAHRAARTGSGGAAIVGGTGSSGGIRDVLLVDLDPRDPALALPSTGASLARARAEPEIVELDDARILVAGGEDPRTLDKLDSVEILSPDGKTVAPPFSMRGARVEHGLATVGAGVLVVGGLADPWTYSRPTAGLIVVHR